MGESRMSLLVGRELDGGTIARERAGRCYWLGESGTAGWWLSWLGESWMVVLLVERERVGWMVVETERDGWMVVERVRQLDGEAADWEGESGTAGWWRCWLEGRERDGWMVALLVGRELDD